MVPMTLDRSQDPGTALELWRRRVSSSGGRVAYRHRRDGAWQGTTWTEADTQAREIAAGLAALGVRPGDRVCLVCQTRLEWVLADVGVLMAGGVTVPIYTSSTA